ncbi:MAG TPA: hypothetical protein PLR96_09335 [Flavobacteriales bacterium]|nr:hypothetical protein [Flavobacteriales bacterium]
MRTFRNITFLLILSIGLSACQDDDPVEPSTPAPPPTASSISFMAVTFTSSNAYFSTTSGMTQPVNASTAQGLAEEIDITLIYDGDYGEVGFFAPLTRSREWYWDQFQQPWLSAADSTTIYVTTLTPAQFTAAQSNSTLIGTYFADASVVYLAPHGIFPTGTCVGGRVSSSPQSAQVAEGTVVGFKNNVTGKRGLIHVRSDQDQLWEILTSQTKVDIIREP